MNQDIQDTVVIDLQKKDLPKYFLAKSIQGNWNIKELSNPKNTDLILDISEFKDFNIIIIPEVALSKIKDSTKVAFLCSKGFSNLLPAFLQKEKLCIKEVVEEISPNGEVITALTEPEINKALRFVFSTKQRHTYLALTNAVRNSDHERFIKNILIPARVNALSANLTNSAFIK